MLQAQTPRSQGSYVAAATADPAPYTRYTPGACAMRIRAEWQYWRTRHPDTVTHAPLGNPRAPANVAASKACVARFDVATVAPADLPWLAEGYLAANEDAKADAALRRWRTVVAQITPAELGWTLVQCVRIYADAAPSRMAKAREALAELDAMGAARTSSRLLARLPLIKKAQFLDDLPLLDTLSTEALTIAKGLTGDSADTYAGAIGSAFLAVADAQSRHGAMDKARATLDNGITYVTRIDPQANFAPQAQREYVFKYFGLPMPKVAATTWINAPKTTVIPAQERPALVVMGLPCPRVRCYEGYAFLRRFRAKHPNMSVVIVTATSGTHGTRLVPVDSEVASLTQYFAERKLDVPVAVWHTTYTTRPDGRRSAKPSPNDMRLVPPIFDGESYAYLVDGKGTIRRLSLMNDSAEAMFDREARELSEIRQGENSSPSAPPVPQPVSTPLSPSSPPASSASAPNGR